MDPLEVRDLARGSGLPEAVLGRNLRHGPSEAAGDGPEVDPRCVLEVPPHLIGSHSKSSWLKLLKRSFPPTLPSNTIQRETKQLVLKETRR